MFSLIILVFAVAMGTKAFSDWWLGYMTSKGDGITRANRAPGSLADNPDRSFYLLIYGMTGVALIVTQVCTPFFSTSKMFAFHNHMCIFLRRGFADGGSIGQRCDHPTACITTFFTA